MELTFFVSVRVPSFSCPRGRSETFASQRRFPRSSLASEMPSARTMSRIVATYAFASAGAECSAPKIGFVTISTSGTPARL